MSNISTRKGIIGILTGGGDVPGLNPAIRGVTFRALREGYQVIGFRHGWGGLIDIVRDKSYDNSENFQILTEDIVNRAGRTGGTFLHSSRTNPGRTSKANVPEHLKSQYNAEKNDLTLEVLKNLAWLGIETLIPIGGDDTLSYGVRLHKEGFKVIAIPKTMDNDVPGTDYCIGFSTCITRTLQLVNSLRTSAGSHERFMVLEVFGRYAGFTAMLTTMAGAANRCVIPEHKFNIERLTELLVEDHVQALPEAVGIARERKRGAAGACPAAPRDASTDVSRSGRSPCTGTPRSWPCTGRARCPRGCPVGRPGGRR